MLRSGLSRATAKRSLKMGTAKDGYVMYGPYGIAKDGHVMYGPYDGSGDLWQPTNVGACNCQNLYHCWWRGALYCVEEHEGMI
jgi:hypothetical protein